MEPRESERFLPLFHSSRDIKVLIVGGGKIALNKTRVLLACGCQITLIASRFARTFNQINYPGLTLIRRPFISGDCRGFNLIIAATSDKRLNYTIYREATELGAMVNVVDNPALCTVIFPAIWQAPAVTIAVSTGGKAPFMAAATRDYIAANGDALSGWVAAGARLRGILRKENLADGKSRKIIKQFAAIDPVIHSNDYPVSDALDDWMDWLKRLSETASDE